MIIYVTSVFAFCPDGNIPIHCYNVPGSIHDSKTAELGDVFPNCLESSILRAESVLLIPISLSRNIPFSSSQVKSTGSCCQQCRFCKRVRLNREATAMRQSAEWGMRAIQSSFPRLKDRFIYEELGERKIILKMMILLYNVRARLVGIIQIKKYMPALNVNANATYVV
jgi:hypothetical protein